MISRGVSAGAATSVRSPLVSRLPVVLIGLLAVAAVGIALFGGAEMPIWIAFGILSLIAIVLSVRFPAHLLAISLAAYALFCSLWLEVHFPVGTLDVNLSQLYLSCVAILLVLGMGFYSHYGPIRANLPVVLGAALGLLLSVSLANLTDFRPALPPLLRYWVGILVFYAAFVLGRESRSNRIVQTGFAVGAFAACATAIHDYLTPHVADPLESLYVGPYRAAGSLGGVTNTGTIALAATYFFAVKLLERPRRLERLVFAAGALVSGVVILLNFTRSSMLGAVLAAIIFATIGQSDRTKGRRGMMILAALAVWAIIGLTILPKSTIESRFGDLQVGDQSTSTRTIGSGRGAIWSIVADGILQSTWGEWAFGHGVEAVTGLVRKRMGIPFQAHNSYLEIAYDAGIVGLALYIAFIIAVLVALWRKATRTRSSGAYLWFSFTLAYYLSTEMFIHHVYYMGGRFFILVFTGLVLADGWPASAQQPPAAMEPTAGAGDSTPSPQTGPS